MDEIQGIQGKLAATRDTNKTILRIANDLVKAESNTCGCDCETVLKETTTKINGIKDEIETLLKTSKENNNRQAVMETQLRKLQNSFRDMEDAILSVKTGESPLKSNENTEPDQNGGEGDDNDYDNCDESEDMKERVEDTAKTDVTSEIEHTPDEPTRVESASIQNLAQTKSNAKHTDRALRPESNTAFLKRTEFRPNIVRTSRDQVKPPETLPLRYSSAKVQVVRQTKKTFMLLGEAGWRNIAQQTLERVSERVPTDGVFTCLCVDISESMARGTAWTEATQFIYDFLDGLEEVRRQHVGAGLQEEYVSLATFGHVTDLQIVHANNYMEIRKNIEDMKLGGPTPLNGGLFMAMAATLSAQRTGPTLDLAMQFHVNPRIIIITDGRVTDLALTGGPDIGDESKAEQTKLDLLKELQEISEIPFDIYCVPVGDADKDMLKLMVGVADGTLMDFHQGRRAARRQYLSSFLRRSHIATMGLQVLAGLTPDFISPEPPAGNEWSQEDKEDMVAIQKSNHKVIRKCLGRTEDKAQYKESTNDSLPAIGSRVRRGPDWKWHDQDSHGPGTVIGHDENEKQLWVEWDTNGDRNVYRYDGRHYDVLLSDEERSLKPGQKIAVGCTVRPGKDGLSSGLKTWDKGVVIRLVYGTSRVENKALVRWENGKRGNYSYGEDGKHEIELWSASGSTLAGSHNKNAAGTSSSSQSGSGMNFARHKNKNS